MAAPAPVMTPVKQLGPHSSFGDDIDHWSGRLGNLTKDYKDSLEIQGTKSWSSSFFEFFNPIDTCLITWCCPCVTFGKTHHRLHKDKNLAGFSPVNASCLGFCVSAHFCLACVPLMLQRSEIRKRAQPHLSGDLAIDFLKAWCCGCCDLIQQDKEAAYLTANESNNYISEQPSGMKQDMSYAPQQTIQNAPYQQQQQHAAYEQKVGM